MEIMPIELSIFVISLILASAIIFLFLRSLKHHYFEYNDNEEFAVIEAIRILKKTCPVQFTNKWKLLNLNWSSTRCWFKNILFPGFKSCLKVYGATCAVTCSSLYAFSLISDVCKWGEWEPSQSSSQNLLLKSFNSNEFKKDHFMQADQITGIHRGTDIQSCVAMYRFLSPATKCTKWILFWNVKRFEFLFFLIQPTTSRNAESQCIITHLYASNSIDHGPQLITQRIRNIKEFLIMSQLSVKTLHSPSASELFPQLESFDKNECSDKEKPPTVFQETDNCDSSNLVFMLVPVFHSIGFILKRLKGYKLVLKKATVKSRSKKSKRKINPPQIPKRHEPLRRTVSDLTISTKHFIDFNISSLHLENHKKISPSESIAALNDLNKSQVDDVFKDGSHAEELPSSKGLSSDQLQPPISRLKLRSRSEPSVTNAEKSKSLSEIISDEENVKSLQSISEMDESIEKVNPDKHEIFCSSTSEFELIDSANQQFLDTTIAGYFTQGNYGASVLQTEMMLASQFDKTNSHTIGNRVAGGWIHTSSYKGIPVLTKCITGKIMKISSFLCQTEIPVQCEDVWKCVKNPQFRFIWDETVKVVKIVNRISDSQKLIHTYHETTGVLKKEAVDFCLLQTEREEKNNFYSVFQSVEYEKCPLMQSVTRGSLKPSGWIVQSLSPKCCKVTYLIQIFVNSPDSLFIQELSSLVPQSLHNLTQYISSKPKQ